MLTGLCLLLGSCQKGLETSDYDETGSCTVLVYMVAENSLYSNIYGNINDMLRAAPKLRKGERVVLYVDDREFPRMYIIDKDSKTRFFDPVFEFNEDFNSASAGTLEQAEQSSSQVRISVLMIIMHFMHLHILTVIII